MKYTILIEGGFTGIPKKYMGEITLTTLERDRLFTAMETAQPPPNEALRDAFSYHIRLEEGERVLDKKFSEPHLPDSLRQFIDQLKQRA